jgi:lipopolysaccharide biosynthesis glycosyltransferase
MRIDQIYIGCYSGDQRFTRILVASIRTWYPNIPIDLIKDESQEKFDTSDIERFWHVDIMECQRKTFGWGFAKLEPLSLEEKKRILLLDSDQIFAGPVLTLIEKYHEDFLVASVNRPVLDPEYVTRTYFDLDALERLDPRYQFPGFVFNSGAIVATSGVLSRSDFEPFIDWRGFVPQGRCPDIFKNADQGILNYLLQKKKQNSELSVRTVPFMKLVRYDDISQPQLSDAGISNPQDFIIHWAGPKPQSFEEFARSDILKHFEQVYWRTIPT